MIWLWIAIGAGIGSALRYGVTTMGKTWWPGKPWATMLINISGAFAAGFFTNLAGLSPMAQTVLLTGLCGGFTTFSTFTVDMVIQLRNRQWYWAMLYEGGSVILGLIAVWLGLTVGA